MTSPPITSAVNSARIGITRPSANEPSRRSTRCGTPGSGGGTAPPSASAGGAGGSVGASVAVVT
jgi:hypothetical protein